MQVKLTKKRGGTILDFKIKDKGYKAIKWILSGIV